MKKTALLLLLSFFTFSPGFAQKSGKSKAPKALDTITKGMLQSKGLITTYIDEENKLYFELSESLLNKELLVVTRYAQLPANYSAYRNAGSKNSRASSSLCQKREKDLLEAGELQQYCLQFYNGLFLLFG